MSVLHSPSPSRELCEESVGVDQLSHRALSLSLLCQLSLEDKVGVRFDKNELKVFLLF